MVAHSSAQAFECVTSSHTSPPHVFSMMGRHASKPSPGVRGTPSIVASPTTTRTHSTKPWSSPTCGSFQTLDSMPCCCPAAGIARPSAPISTGAVCVFVTFTRSVKPRPSGPASYERVTLKGMPPGKCGGAGGGGIVPVPTKLTTPLGCGSSGQVAGSPWSVRSQM